MFYTPQPTHLDTRIWDEDGNSEAIILLYQPTIGAIIDDVINTLRHLKPLSNLLLVNLHPEEVYITSFPDGYLLPTFIVYKGNSDPLKHIREFSRMPDNEEQRHPPLETIYAVPRWDGI